MESLLVPDDLYSDNATVFVVDTSNDLSETALAEHVHNFITICQMIAKHNVIVAAFVVVAIVSSFRIFVFRLW